MLGSQRLVPDLHSALQKCLSWLGVGLLPGEEGQRGQRFPHLEVGQLQMPLLSGERPGGQPLLGAGVLTLSAQQFPLGRQPRRQRRMVGFVVPFPQRHGWLEQGTGLLTPSTPHERASRLAEHLACLWQLLASTGPAPVPGEPGGAHRPGGTPGRAG